MANLKISETFVNMTENCIFGESGVIESFTDDISALYKDLRSQYGSPKNMYNDFKDGSTKKVGWVFTKNDKYEDSNETYKREVWVTVYNPDETYYSFK